ncbi:MAG: hypothetical protein IJX02_04080 [Clostridia bacterium]|nr:hypothetical protein [Clostridia bacterium]
MIKGCHKSIVFLKNTGSELFEEAYFIVKPGANVASKEDIVYQATQLANGLCKQEHKLPKKRTRLLFFLLGCLVGFGIMLLLHFIFI